MLKITLKPVAEFNVSFNGKPVCLRSIKFRAGLLGELDTLMREVREEGCDNSFSFLEYGNNVVIFFKHFNNRDIPILGTRFSFELLPCLMEVESAIARLYTEDEVV